MMINVNVIKNIKNVLSFILKCLEKINEKVTLNSTGLAQVKK